MSKDKDYAFQAILQHHGYSLNEIKTIIKALRNVTYIGKIFVESVIIAAKRKGVPFQKVSRALKRQSSIWSKNELARNDPNGIGGDVFMHSLSVMCDELGIKFSSLFTKGSSESRSRC